MRNVFFGLATQYDEGTDTSIAINAAGVVVEVHSSHVNSGLWHHVGAVNGETIQWCGSVRYDEGRLPSVALNNHNVAVEVHQSQSGSGLWYHVGAVSGNTLTWGGSIHYDDGADPSVAINDDGVVLEVHRSQSNSGLWSHLGRINGNMIKFGGSVKFATGNTPQVAMNNSGVVVCVYEDSKELWCRVGYAQDGDSIRWCNSTKYDTGLAPSVAITDDGSVVEVHRSEDWVGLWRRMGRVSGDAIVWESGPSQYDDGANPSVACAGTLAVQTHQSEAGSALWVSNCMIMDRSCWMTDRLPALGSKNLQTLVLPASHDSAMYLGGLATLGKTQNLSIYDQLNYGIRYFDLRPEWNGNSFDIYHGPITGAALSTVLKQVVQFMQNGSQELVILKISHYDSFDDGAVTNPDGSVVKTNPTYKALTAQITAALKPWLLTKAELGATRLGEATLSQMVGNGGRVVVVCDGDQPVQSPTDGIWVYRDWDSDNPAQGDLRVFDVYADTSLYDKMKDDQIAKFNAYTGYCANLVDGKAVKCDMFLLSWTLSPPTDVWNGSTRPNRTLASALGEMTIPNSHGQIVNLLYVDYVEYARVTDVAATQNGVG